MDSITKIQIAKLEIEILATLTKEQKAPFLVEMSSRRKNKSTALLFLIFLGGTGAHHFYLGNTTPGLLYLILNFVIGSLCAIFTCLISLIISLPVLWTFLLIEVCSLSTNVEEANLKIAKEIASRVVLAYPNEEA